MERNMFLAKSGPLLDDKGRLAEKGWSNQLIKTYERDAIKASKLRIKEWDYYLILGKEFGIAMTISDDGYIGLQSVTLLDFTKAWEHTETLLNPFPMGKFHLPSDSGKGITFYQDQRLQMKFEVTKDEMGLSRHLTCHFERFYQEKPFDCDVTLTQYPGDTMVIATPWKNKPKNFYYNQKINCMKASGFASFDGKEYQFDPETDLGTLDWGRGVWTYDNVWYWGSGNGYVQEKPFGFNIGYGFGDTRAASENILFYEGKAHKLDDVTFIIPKDEKGDLRYEEPWKFTSSDGRFEMDFLPVIDRKARTNALIIETDQHQVFGRMSGRVVLDDGTELMIENLLCFAEHVHNRY